MPIDVDDNSKNYDRINTLFVEYFLEHNKKLRIVIQDPQHLTHIVIQLKAFLYWSKADQTSYVN